MFTATFSSRSPNYPDGMDSPGREHGPGAGNHLPISVLVLSGACTLIATVVSCLSIFQHLKSYRKPYLQRMVIRIIIMVPVYGISSYIALYSLDAAFFIDAVRDIYEAFVIYCFFQLLLCYLGGERSLLILLHGRPPKSPVFPLNLFKHEIDVSDPQTFLLLKRGILQYVQVKPVLTIVTMILKATNTYNEGNFRANSGYLYIAIIYNVSIAIALYCLAMFWVVVNDDLQGFRPMPKFLCVKGILFFSFWQSIVVSIFVAAGLITHLGPYRDEEHISLGLTDALVCIEMPLFAIAHAFAFAPRDFSDPHLQYVARMPMWYAFRDAFGAVDVVEDSRTTLRGEGMDYRAFEPSEGYMHQGAAREHRIRAGLRYSKHGRRKYWLPRTGAPAGRIERGVNTAIERVAAGQGEDMQAPLLHQEAQDTVHLAPDLQPDNDEWDAEWQWHSLGGDPEQGFELPFGDIDPEDEALFQGSKTYLFGDYNYPCIDVSSEEARGKMWEEEERILRDERGAWASPIRGGKGYGAVGTHPRTASPRLVENGKGKERGHTPDPTPDPGVYDRLVDFDQDRTPSEEPGDYKLKWSNVKRKSSRPGSGSNSQSASRSPQTRSRKVSDLKSPASASSSPGSSSGAKAKLPPAMERANSRTLPPDAVDLVVEDPNAAEEERKRERRKGEPALGGSTLRKVYRRGFVAHDAEGEQLEGEVEVAGDGAENADREVEVPADREQRDPDLPEEIQEEDKVVEEIEGTVARAETPPTHARVFDLHEHGDNPWA